MNDVYGQLAVEGLTCGLHVVGLVAEVGATAAAPPVGFFAAAVMTETVLAVTTTCVVFVSHATITATGGMDSKQSENFQRGVQILSSPSSLPAALNTIGYLTDNPVWKDAAAITTSVLILKNATSPGETKPENILKGIENIQGMIDIGNRAEERDREARTARKSDSEGAFSKSGSAAQCTDLVEIHGDPPVVEAPGATEEVEKVEENRARGPEKSSHPPAPSPSGVEDKFDQPRSG